MIDREKSPLGKELENSKLTLAYIPDGKINQSRVISLINEDIKVGKKLYISTSGFIPKNTQGTKVINLADTGIDYLIDKGLKKEEKALQKLEEYIKDYDHIFIEEVEDLSQISVSESKEKRVYFNKQSIELFKLISIENHNKHIFLFTQRPNVAHIMRSTHKSFGVGYIELKSHDFDIKDIDDTALVDALEDDFEVDESFFDTVEEPQTVQVNIPKIDEILSANNTEYGDTVFFAYEKHPELARYAIDAIIPNAKTSEQVCFITPFREEKKLKKSLKTLSSFYPLTRKALKRTSIYTSEHLRGVDLDTSSALMDMIRGAIVDFRGKLDMMGRENGICIIDTIDMDEYGAEIDYPTVKWYAKSNNILIIIGADTAEERYTHKRQERLEKNDKKMLPNALTSK